MHHRVAHALFGRIGDHVVAVNEQEEFKDPDQEKDDKYDGQSEFHRSLSLVILPARSRSCDLWSSRSNHKSQFIARIMARRVNVQQVPLDEEYPGKNLTGIVNGGTLSNGGKV